MENKKITTIDYGVIRIAEQDESRFSDIIDNIMDAEGVCYSVEVTEEGEVVAIPYDDMTEDFEI